MTVVMWRLRLIVPFLSIHVIGKNWVNRPKEGYYKWFVERESAPIWGGQCAISWCFEKRVATDETVDTLLIYAEAVTTRLCSLGTRYYQLDVNSYWTAATLKEHSSPEMNCWLVQIPSALVQLSATSHLTSLLVFPSQSSSTPPIHLCKFISICMKKTFHKFCSSVPKFSYRLCVLYPRSGRVLTTITKNFISYRLSGHVFAQTD